MLFEEMTFEQKLLWDELNHDYWVAQRIRKSRSRWITVGYLLTFLAFLGVVRAAFRSDWLWAGLNLGLIFYWQRWSIPDNRKLRDDADELIALLQRERDSLSYPAFDKERRFL